MGDDNEGGYYWTSLVISPGNFVDLGLPILESYVVAALSEGTGAQGDRTGSVRMQETYKVFSHSSG